MLIFVLSAAMNESLPVSLKRVFDTSNNIGLEFVPPMSAPAMKKNHPIPDNEDGSESMDMTPPKKKREVSLGDELTPGVAVVEPTAGSTETSPVPTPSTATASAEPAASGESNDRTSKDYYFDSYSHHAIRE